MHLSPTSKLGYLSFKGVGFLFTRYENIIRPESVDLNQMCIRDIIYAKT